LNPAENRIVILRMIAWSDLKTLTEPLIST
jgi:hypothetical protein